MPNGSSAEVPLWRQMVRSWRFSFVLAVIMAVCVFVFSLAMSHPENVRRPFLVVGIPFFLLAVLFVSPFYPPFRRLSPQNKTLVRIVFGVWMLLLGTFVV